MYVSPTNNSDHVDQSRVHRQLPKQLRPLSSEVAETALRTALFEEFISSSDKSEISTHPFNAKPLNDLSNQANSSGSEDEKFVSASSGSSDSYHYVLPENPDDKKVRNKPAPPPKLSSKATKEKNSGTKETKKTPPIPPPKPSKLPGRSSPGKTYTAPSPPTTTVTTSTSTTTPSTTTIDTKLPSSTSISKTTDVDEVENPIIQDPSPNPRVESVDEVENPIIQDPSPNPPVESTASKVMAYATMALLIAGFIACLAAAPFTGGISLWAAPFLFFAAMAVPVVLTFAEVQTNQAIASLRQQLANVTPQKVLGQKKNTLEEEIEKLEKKQANPRSPLNAKKKQELADKKEELELITKQINETKALAKKQEGKRKAAANPH